MNDYSAISDAASASIAVERQVLKGKGILDLCLEQGKNLCMKGFIDSQIERGNAYVPVVEQMVSYIDRQLAHAENKDRRALLLDLHNYADAQLRALGAAWHGPPGEG
jgi:hypothetical protein